MDKARIARKLSAAFGTKVAEGEIERVYTDHVWLRDGRFIHLAAGNRARQGSADGLGEPRYFHNGTEIDFDSYYDGLGM